MSKKKKKRARDAVAGSATAPAISTMSSVAPLAVDRVLLWATSRMAEHGPEILAHLRERVGGELMSGHVIDVLMNAASEMEAAASSGWSKRYEEAAIVVLFLARDLAYRQGKMAAPAAATGVAS